MSNIDRIHKRAATCLYVEDERELRESMVKLLENFFEKVLEAKDGGEAYDMFVSNKVDVVITDLSMPNDGTVLIDRIREVDKTVPIVVCTAHREFMGVYKDVRYMYMLVKPVVLDHMLKVLVSVDIDMVNHRAHIEAFEALHEVQEEARKILEGIWGIHR